MDVAQSSRALGMEELRAWATQGRSESEARPPQPRLHPVFQGSLVVPVSEVEDVLRDLASGSRKTLSVFAEAALAELAGQPGTAVKVDRRLMVGMLQVWDVLRELEPARPDRVDLNQRVDGWPGSALVWTGERFEQRPICHTRCFGGVVLTDVDGRRLGFDEASGELRGVAFNPYLLLS